MSKNRVLISSIWSIIDRFSVQGIQFLFSIILARLLLPSDYGLIAMLSIFLAISQTLLDCGFSNALIHKVDRTEIDKSTVFYYNLFIGIILYIILYFSSPYIAVFYDASILTLLLRYMSITIPINSLSLIHRTLLQLQYNYKLQAKISLISVVLSGLGGIALAFSGYGVWALVVQSLLNSLFMTFLYWIFVTWHPKLVFSRASLSELFTFGNNILFSGLLRTLYTNVYSLVIGKCFMSLELGFYSRADSLSQFASTNLTMTFIRVFYPSLCDNQNNRVDMFKMYFKYMKIICLIVFPISVLVIVLSPPLIIVLLGEKWVPAVHLLQILSLGYMFYPIYNLNNAAWQAFNRPDMVLKAECIYKVVGVCILLITLPWGIKWLAWGAVVTSIITTIISLLYTMVNFKLPIGKLLIPVLKISLLSLVMQLLTFTFISFIPIGFSQLILGGIVGILVFILCDCCTFRMILKLLKNE